MGLGDFYLENITDHEFGKFFTFNVCLTQSSTAFLYEDNLLVLDRMLHRVLVVKVSDEPPYVSKFLRYSVYILSYIHYIRHFCVTSSEPPNLSVQLTVISGGRFVGLVNTKS